MTRQENDIITTVPTPWGLGLTTHEGGYLTLSSSAGGRKEGLEASKRGSLTTLHTSFLPETP